MKLEDVKCIGILGGGVMGGGIAQSAILAGHKVIVRDLTDFTAGGQTSRRQADRGGPLRDRVNAPQRCQPPR